MIIVDNLFLILISLALGLALPLIGVFVILRREALLSDALAHVLLLGIALALFFKTNVWVGILAFALLAALGIYFVKKKTVLGMDTVVGVFFTTSLAIGSLMMEEHDLLEAFLGNLEKLTRGDVLISLGLAAVIIIALVVKFRDFAYAAFAPDLAVVDKINIKKYELAFVLLLALGVAIGIKLVGTLLISALIIIPAATAKIFSLQIRSMAVWSMVLGVIAVLGGLAVATYTARPPGPVIILAGAAIFLVVFIANSVSKAKLT